MRSISRILIWPSGCFSWRRLGFPSSRVSCCFPGVSLWSASFVCDLDVAVRRCSFGAVVLSAVITIGVVLPPPSSFHQPCDWKDLALLPFDFSYSWVLCLAKDNVDCKLWEFFVYYYNCKQKQFAPVISKKRLLSRSSFSWIVSSWRSTTSWLPVIWN